jgi:4-aminobutyrate aminotransferase-like enzyme
MAEPIEHPSEDHSNRDRASAMRYEPRSLRTYTPTQAVLAKSAGIYHWTPEGRRLYDFTSGVLVANLGHNPTRWMQRFADYMGWPKLAFDQAESAPGPNLIRTTTGGQADVPAGFFSAVALTAYNGVTRLEAEASRRLIAMLRANPGGGRMDQVMWAASGSEAIQKALWAAMARDRTRPMILATRNGFHGKKGLAGAVTGSETDAERDPRVKFFSFPAAECRDVSQRDHAFDPAPFRKELEALLHQYGRKIGALITEPYLGGGGSFHPPKEYLQLLEQFCRDNDIIFILDEVQSNFGRTGNLFAFTTYGIEPDIVVLGKGLGNGVPVAAAVGRADWLRRTSSSRGTFSARPGRRPR